MGVIPRQNEGFWWFVFVLFWGGFGVVLGLVEGWFGDGLGWVWLVLSLVLARLALLDLTRYVLPNVYTIPLVVVGVVGVERGELGARGGAWAMGELPGVVGGLLAWLSVSEFMVAPEVLAVWGGMAVVMVGWFVWAWVASWLGWPTGMGGGDVKLLLAMIAWLGPVGACWAVAVGCVLYMPFVLRQPMRAVPFGVPLVLGWVTIGLLAGSIGL